MAKNDKSNDTTNTSDSPRVDAGPEPAGGPAQTGSLTSHDPNPNTDKDVFDTGANGPVRDRVADESKGTPVARYFTKDGTPVEPASLPGKVTPSNLAGKDLEARPDVVTAIEYIDAGGNTVTHDSLKANKEVDNKRK